MLEFLGRFTPRNRRIGWRYFAIPDEVQTSVSNDSPACFVLAERTPLLRHLLNAILGSPKRGNFVTEDVERGISVSVNINVSVGASASETLPIRHNLSELATVQPEKPPIEDSPTHNPLVRLTKAMTRLRTRALAYQ